MNEKQLIDDELNYEPAFITLEGDDGSSHECEILDVFEYGEHEYAILLKLDEDNLEERKIKENCLIIMRLIRKGEQSIFQTIEDDTEFDNVKNYIESFARDEEEREQGL